MLILTFGLAGVEKLLDGQIPNWFLSQFNGTILDAFPGALEISFVLITLLEIVTATLLIIGLARKEFLLKFSSSKRFLCLGIILAQITFIVLGFGQRLTHKFDAAGSLFFYATLTFIAGQMALKAE